MEILNLALICLYLVFAVYVGWSLFVLAATVLHRIVNGQAWHITKKEGTKSTALISLVFILPVIYNAFPLS